MKTLVSLCFLLFGVLGDSALAQTALDQTDHQQWIEVQLAAPVTGAIDFNFLGGLRLGRNISHPVDQRVGVGFTFRLGKYVVFAPHYLHILTRPFENRKGWENRLVMPLTLRFNAGAFRLSDRNQIERRFRSNGTTSTRYRKRFQVEHPIGADNLKLSLFVSDEVFYDWSVDRWVRNRFSIGVSKVFNNHFTQDFYYTRQNDGLSIPGDLNVIGTALRFKL